MPSPPKATEIMIELNSKIAGWIRRIFVDCRIESNANRLRPGPYSIPEFAIAAVVQSLSAVQMSIGGSVGHLDPDFHDFGWRNVQIG